MSMLKMGWDKLRRFLASPHTWTGTQTFTGLIASTIRQLTGAADGAIPVSDADGDLILTTSTGTGAPVRAVSPTLTGTPLSPTAASGTNTTQLATTAFTQGEIAVTTNPLSHAQGVALTAAASGSNGIRVADNSNLDPGTGNFFIAANFLVPLWTSETYIYFSTKIRLYIDPTPAAALYLAGSGGTIVDAGTGALSILSSLVAGSKHRVCAVITRETALVAGSAAIYVDGNLVGTIVVPAGSGGAISTAGIRYFFGQNTKRYASTVSDIVQGNFAPTAAEVKDMFLNGIPEAWKWGSQTELCANGSMELDSNWTSTGTPTVNERSSEQAHSGTYSRKMTGDGALDGFASDAFTITAGKTYAVEGWVYGDGTGKASFHITDGLSVNYLSPSSVSVAVGYAWPAAWTRETWTFTAAASSATAKAALIESSAGVNGTWYLDDVTIRQIGATLALEPGGIQPAPGQWFDNSTNKNHAKMPIAGATVTQRKKDFEVRWTNTWAGTHEAQYVGGVNESILPPNCYVQSIIGIVSGSTIEDIILGDGSDTDHWVAITTGLAAGTVVFAVANATSDGTNYKLVVDPDANFTGSIIWTIKGIILEA